MISDSETVIEVSYSQHYLKQSKFGSSGHLPAPTNCGTGSAQLQTRLLVNQSDQSEEINLGKVVRICTGFSSPEGTSKELFRRNEVCTKNQKSFLERRVFSFSQGCSGQKAMDIELCLICSEIRKRITQETGDQLQPNSCPLDTWVQIKGSKPKCFAFLLHITQPPHNLA